MQVSGSRSSDPRVLWQKEPDIGKPEDLVPEKATVKFNMSNHRVTP